MGDGSRSDDNIVRTAAVVFSAAVFSLDTVKRAAYRFLNAASADFACDNGSIVCTLLFHKPLDLEAAAAIERDLRAEVLDQDLRQTISEETSATRNAILAYALSKTGLQGNE